MEDLGRPCFPRRQRGECAIPELRPFSQQLGTPLRKSQFLGMCEAVPVTHGAGFRSTGLTSRTVKLVVSSEPHSG